jgi:hypothetical protein
MSAMPSPMNWYDKPFDDEGLTVSAAFAHNLDLPKSLILDHLFFTFIHHYDSPGTLRMAHPDPQKRLDDKERTWIFFTLKNFERHIPLARSSIRDHLKELEAMGWIEVIRFPGQKVFYRPNLARFVNSSHYRAKAKRCTREPDLPGGATEEAPAPAPFQTVQESATPQTRTVPETGTPPCRNPAQYPAGNRHGRPTLVEPSKEPFNEEPRTGAPANAREATEGEEDSGGGGEPQAARERVIRCLLEGTSLAMLRRECAAHGLDVDEVVAEATRRHRSGKGGKTPGSPPAVVGTSQRSTVTAIVPRAPEPPRSEGVAAEGAA